MRPFVALALAATLAACHRHASASDLPPERTVHRTSEHIGDVTLSLDEVTPPRGPLLLVVHDGPGLDHTYLRPWLDPLADHARLVYVDLRGHGRSSAPADAEGFSLVAAASDLAQLVSRLSPSAPANLLGHGFGGAVVLELASRHPELVRRVVLVDPLRDGVQLQAFATRAQATLGASGYARLLSLETPQGTLRDAHGAAEWFRRLGRMWWHARPADDVLDRMARDLFYRGDTDAAFRVDLASWDGRTAAPDVRAPVLVISGADDATALPSESRALAEALPHGRYAELADAGHCPFIEQNARFVALAEHGLRDDPGAE